MARLTDTPAFLLGCNFGLLDLVIDRLDLVVVLLDFARDVVAGRLFERRLLRCEVALALIEVLLDGNAVLVVLDDFAVVDIGGLDGSRSGSALVKMLTAEERELTLAKSPRRSSVSYDSSINPQMSASRSSAGVSRSPFFRRLFFSGEPIGRKGSS